MLMVVKFVLATVAAAAVAGACGGTVRAPRPRLSPKQIIEHSKAAIVRITVYSQHGAGVGSGFAVGTDGRIVTNYHVIEEALQAEVELHDGSTFPVEQVVAVDEAHDLAVIRIPRPGMKTLAIGDSDRVEPGDRVYAIGNPLGAGWTISDGLISALQLVDQVTLLQISAPISQGSSGGPLLNPYGEVIGVAMAIAEQGQNVNFGMPINYLQPMLTATGGEAFHAFAARPKPSARIGRPRVVDIPDGPSSRRRVPVHPIEVLDGCSGEDVQLVATEMGAPIYNKGDHETCFRIYEGTALKLERELPTTCQGPRSALGQGLLRAQTLETYTEKAWAMRDAFDGMIDVITRHLRGE
jgi:hypothetical protein